MSNGVNSFEGNGSGMTEFDTGAVRSTDANGVAYHLISPIGLKRLAKIATGIKIELNPLNKALAEINDFLSGSRIYDHLACACFYVMLQMEYDEKNEYIRPADLGFGENYIAIPRVGLRRLAETYKEGEVKYSAYNCERGFPIHDLLNHCLKHIYDYLEKENREDDLGHASWNLIMSMHSEELWPHLNKAWLRGPGCTLTQEMDDEIEKTIFLKKEERKNV